MLLRPFAGSTCVSIVVPLLHNIDVSGVVLGLTKSACQLSTSVIKVLLCLVKPVTVSASDSFCHVTQ